jgi:polysaccharide deacetylase family protein (PEP-CTERM system associated)
MSTPKPNRTVSDSASSGGCTVPVTGLLTIDVEDWYQLSAQLLGGQETSRPAALERQLDRVLDLLAEAGCRATFFCLGKSLVAVPHLVKKLVNAGHEIASHGWGHQPVFKIGLSGFRRDLCRSMAWLSDITGQPVRGYRAPAFSVREDQLESFHDICFEVGLEYDSSVFPIRGRRYGIPEASPVPHVVRQDGVRRLVEFPLATVHCFGRRHPIAGGGWWRVLPRCFIRAALARYDKTGGIAMTYFHPHEFDTRPLDAKTVVNRSWQVISWNLRQNLGRSSVYGKLKAMLTEFRFGAVEDYLRDRLIPTAETPVGSNCSLDSDGVATGIAGDHGVAVDRQQRGKAA